MSELSATEALYGFVAWLTTREEPVTISAKHDTTAVIDLAAKFCEANNLPQVTKGWAKNIKIPRE